MDKPLLVGIAGGTSVGKSTFATRIAEKVGVDQTVILPEESYYFDQTHLSGKERKEINFDAPESIDFDLMAAHLQLLIAGRSVPRLHYLPDLCVRQETGEMIESKPVVLVEGILILADARIRDLLDVKIYLDADSDLRFIRRLEREVNERGKDLEEVCRRYLTKVKPMHLKHVLGSKRYADVVVPQGGRNRAALRIILSTIHTALHPPEDL